MWYPFKFYRNLTHVHVSAELGGNAGRSRSHARAYRRALRKNPMPAAVIAGTAEDDMKLVGWSTTVDDEFHAYVLCIEVADSPIYVQTNSGPDTLRLLPEHSPFTGWHTSLQGLGVVVFHQDVTPPEPVDLELRHIPGLLNQGPRA